MAYAITGNTTPAYEGGGGGRSYRAYTVVETDARDTREFTLRVPPVGTITMYQWELTVLGSSTTMRPTFRTATGAWDGAGAGSNGDVTRPSAAAQGSEQTGVKYYAPGGLLYVRNTYSGTAEDAGGELRVVVMLGH